MADFVYVVKAVTKNLEEDVIGHLLTELIVAEAAVLDEWCDIVPVLLIVLTIGLAEA